MQIYLRMKIKSTADFHAGQYHITSATIIALSLTNSVSLKVGEGGGTERFLSFRNHVCYSARSACNRGKSPFREQ